MRKLVFRFGGFAILPLLSAVAPLLLLPIIARVGGVGGWASIATAQSIGTFGAVVVSFGWTIAGPPLIAREPSTELQKTLYVKSFSSRVVVFLVTLPILSILSASLASRGFEIDSMSMTAAMTFFGLSPAWYCIGLGRPRLIAIFEAVPKFIATAMAAGLLLAGSPIWAYPVLLMAASALGLLSFHRTQIGAWWPWQSRREGSLLSSLRTMVIPALVDMTGASYGAAPLPIASATIGVLATSIFASADKLFRYGLFGISALANALQAWVLESASAAPRKRQLAAIFAHLLLGLMGLAVLSFAAPWVTGVLFGDRVKATSDVGIWFGVAYFFISVTTPLMRNLLLPNGKAHVILRATIVSALVGLPTMIIGGLDTSGAGVAAGLAVSEVMILVFILPESLRQLRRIG